MAIVIPGVEIAIFDSERVASSLNDDFSRIAIYRGEDGERI